MNFSVFRLRLYFLVCVVCGSAWLPAAAQSGSVADAVARVSFMTATHVYYSAWFRCDYGEWRNVKRYARVCADYQDGQRSDAFIAELQREINPKILAQFSQDDVLNLAQFLNRPYYTPAVARLSPKLSTFILLGDMLMDISPAEQLEMFDGDAQRLAEYHVAQDFLHTDLGKRFEDFYGHDALIGLTVDAVLGTH